MELRRALLLFVIVLGVAAIASSIARPPESADDERATGRSATAPSPSTPSAEPRSTSPATTIEFKPAAKPQTQELEVRQPATVLVDVAAPGEVVIPSLGLTQPAEPLTPARFELLLTEAGEHPIATHPAAADAQPTKVGTLRVVPAS